MSDYVLRLYVTGHTVRSKAAIQQMREICEAVLGGSYVLDIIDVIERPQLAADERIIATPTVVRALPEPLRRIVGDLSNMEQVLVGLDLVPASAR